MRKSPVTSMIQVDVIRVIGRHQEETPAWSKEVREKIRQTFDDLANHRRRQMFLSNVFSTAKIESAYDIPQTIPNDSPAAVDLIWEILEPPIDEIAGSADKDAVERTLDPEGDDSIEAKSIADRHPTDVLEQKSCESLYRPRLKRDSILVKWINRLTFDRGNRSQSEIRQAARDCERGSAYRKGDFEKALMDCRQKAIELDPSKMRVHSFCAWSESPTHAAALLKKFFVDMD